LIFKLFGADFVTASVDISARLSLHLNI